MPTFIADTSAWIGYFDQDERFKEWMEQNRIETPASVVAELIAVLIRRGHSTEIREKACAAIFSRSIILPLDFEKAKKAGEQVAKEKLHFADALAYAFASKEKFILTSDPHFRDKNFVQFIK